MSKLSTTITSTPEEKWGLLADSIDHDEQAPDDAIDATEPGTANADTDTEPDADTGPDVEADVDTEADADADGVGDAVAEKKSARRLGRSARRHPTGRTLLTARRVGVGALAVVAIAAVVVAAILGWKLNDQRNIDDAAAQARSTAEQYAVTLTSVSSDDLDQNFAAVLDGATGEFKDMYSQSSGQLRDLLVENKANAQGTVISSGIKSATTSKVEVLLFVDQSVTNTATPDARIDRSRVLMTMEKVDGRWLASKVELP